MMIKPTTMRKWLFAGMLGFSMTAMAERVSANPSGSGSHDRHEWLAGLQTKLDELGLSPEATGAAAAAVEAIVQTVDAGARIVDSDEWLAIRERREGLFYLPGFTIGMTNGLPYVREVAAGSTAEKAGITPGDVLTGIGTQLFDKIAVPDVLSKLRGTSEGSVSLQYRHGDVTSTVVVTRALLRETAVEIAELLPNNIGYIKVNGLYPGAGREIVSRVRAWSETRGDGIILDLRGAGGADAAAVAQVAALYSRGGQFLFAFRDHHQQDIDVFKAPEGSPVTMPVMILIDRHTTGAGEVLAAVINGIAREALLIGEATPGDFLLREAVEISGYQVFMTTRVLDTSDGYRYNGQFGLQPGVVIAGRERDTHDYEPAIDLLDRREKLEEEERDAATRRRVRGDGTLERAIDILIGLKSLNKAASKVSSPDMF